MAKFHDGFFSSYHTWPAAGNKKEADMIRLQPTAYKSSTATSSVHVCVIRIQEIDLVTPLEGQSTVRNDAT